MMGEIIKNLMRDIGKVGSERYRKGPAAVVIEKKVVEGPKVESKDELDEILEMLRAKKDEDEGAEVKPEPEKEDGMEDLFSEEKEEENWMDKPEILDEVLKERKKRLGRA